MRHLRFLTFVAAAVVLQANMSLGYGTFTCYDPAGREVGVVDSGTETGVDPTALCNARLAACAGQCSGARHFGGHTGRWVETWHYPNGIEGDNSMVPGGDTGQDARTVIREGLIEPEQTPPPNE